MPRDCAAQPRGALDIAPAAVPEPGALALVGAALLALTLSRRRA